MDRISELRAQRAETVDDFADLSELMNADDYEDNEDDQKEYDDLKKKIETFDGKIKRVEEANKLKASTAVAVMAQESAKVYPLPKRRYGTMKAFKGTVDGMDAEERAYRSGMFVRGTLLKDTRALDWCRENGMAPNLKFQSEGVNTAGGFLVPTEFETAIIDLREEYGTFRRECRLVPMASDHMTIPRRASGVTAYYVGENAQITESQKGWDQVTLTAKKLGALTRMSTELAEDAVISVADDLAQEMAYAFAVAEDAAGWTGDGTSTYGGIAGLKKKFDDGVNSFVGAVNAATGVDTFAEITAASLASVMAALPKYAERNAKWYMSMQAWAAGIQRLVVASGGTTMTELTAGGKPQRSYLGYPVVIDQTLPTTLSTINDTPMLYFGDLSLAARMGDRRGITVKTTEDRYFEFDQIGIQATERFDIVVHDVGNATTAGPIVALMGFTS